MSDEDRIAKLQKLLDRVLTRAEPEEPPSSDGSNGERTQISEGPPSVGDAADADALERSAEPSGHDVPRAAAKEEEAVPPDALESRSRLVSAEVEPEELTEDDLLPPSESPDMLEAAAVPLVRRSKRPSLDALPPHGIVDERSFAEEIAEEEIHSGELREEAPISSRRPIESESAELPGDDEAGERHSSPPESGRQISAAPVAAPPASTRKSTMPPPSREPDVMRAESPVSGTVASFTTRAAPRPVTFGELVDQALAL